RRICDAIKDRLKKDGLYFVGVDIIGNKLVEVNCVSPGGIPRINRLDKVKLEAKVIDFIEQKVSEMRTGLFQSTGGLKDDASKKSFAAG
ncbi:MAG: glutathione synthetase, partial [Deltaproteobacteria bacterium]|nr:glutathione synthetase [Deltaproteobacteria bacterium]